MSRRDRWYIKNICKRHIGIGDLPFMPTLSPGASVDLLDFHSKVQIEQSKHLLATIKKRWVMVTKVSDAGRCEITHENAEQGLTVATKADLSGSSVGTIARHLSSLDVSGVAGEIGFHDGRFYGFTGERWTSLMPTWNDLGA